MAEVPRRQREAAPWPRVAHVQKRVGTPDIEVASRNEGRTETGRSRRSHRESLTTTAAPSPRRTQAPMPIHDSLHRRTGVQSGTSCYTREGAIGSCLDMPRKQCHLSRPGHGSPEDAPSVLKFGQNRPASGHLVHVLPSASASEMSATERLWTASDTRNARICRMGSRQKRRYLQPGFDPDSTPRVCLVSKHCLWPAEIRSGRRVRLYAGFGTRRNRPGGCRNDQCASDQRMRRPVVATPRCSNVAGVAAWIRLIRGVSAEDGGEIGAGIPVGSPQLVHVPVRSGHRGDERGDELHFTQRSLK